MRIAIGKSGSFMRAVSAFLPYDRRSCIPRAESLLDGYSIPTLAVFSLSLLPCLFNLARRLENLPITSLLGDWRMADEGAFEAVVADVDVAEGG